MQHRLGIVLSGGGARGIGHIGVLEALAEHGIVPEVCAGSSAGALVGALWAAGYSSDEMLEFFETRSPFRLSKVTLAKPGILDTTKIRRDFLDYFPDDSFEALGKRLFVTATDLEEGRLEVFSSGPLIGPVVASSSVPLVFTPTEVGGHWYADGGLIDNFPVEPLLGLCDKIIGVYASPLMRRERTEIKSTLAVAHRGLELSMYFSSKPKFHRCDALLVPDALGEFGVFDVKRRHEIYRTGYRAAIERIDEIRQAVGG